MGRFSVGPQAYTDLPKLLKNKRNSKKKEINLKFPEIQNLILKFDKKTGKVSDFVTIQEGCDKFCSFLCCSFYKRSRIFKVKKIYIG